MLFASTCSEVSFNCTTIVKSYNSLGVLYIFASL